MKHLICIDDLSVQEIKDLVGRAIANPPFHERRESRNPAVALIFLEASTRTRVSFQRACQQLSLDHILLEAKGSSLEKEESLYDTVLNLRSMGVNYFVIRSKDENVFSDLMSIGNVNFVNAGAGQSYHPTQALLDLATLVSVYGDFESAQKKKITLFGDVLHSRVARSWGRLAEKLNLDLAFCGPEHALPTQWGGAFKQYFHKKEALEHSDVLMPLRVQRERHQSNGASDWKSFVEGFQLCADDLRESQFLMSPGPVNWGVELDESLQQDKRSLILYQVKIGVHLRATLLDQFMNN